MCEDASTSSPRREEGVRRRSVRRRLAKSPGSAVPPAPGPGGRAGWGGSPATCTEGSCSGGGEGALSCGLGRATAARWGCGNKEGCQDAIARLGKPLADRSGCRGVEKKSQGFFYGTRRGSSSPSVRSASRTLAEEKNAMGKTATAYSGNRSSSSVSRLPRMSMNPRTRISSSVTT